MAILRTIAGWARRTAYGREAVASRADLSLFRQPPSFTLVLGLILLVLSYVIGWPCVLAAGALAVYLKDPLIFAIGGPATYALSWLVWGVSLLLMGKDNIRYMKALLRYGVRVFIEKYGAGDQGENKPSV